MNETINVDQFDATKLMGFAKELFDKNPNILTQLDAHKGKVPAVDQKVAEVKAELMRINAGGEPGPHARMLLPLLEDLAKREFTITYQEPSLTQTSAHSANGETAVQSSNSLHAANRYGG